MFAALPSDVHAQCSGALSPCELALFESAIIWEDKSKQCELSLTTTLGKLEARSSTVVATSVVVEPPCAAKPISMWDAVVRGMAIGGAGLAVGIILGLVLR